MRDWEWEQDPKHLVFCLSRYKFVSKMLAGSERVVEIGAQQGWASEIVRREVGELILTDKLEYPGITQHDILKGPVQKADAVYCLDVIEHIKPSETRRFIKNLKLSLNPKGICIVGSPSFESRKFATEKMVHINCMKAKTLKTEMERQFNPVFIFGMNDEVIHTGFDAMRHYNLAIGIA